MPATLVVTATPHGPVFEAAPGSFESFVVERYILFSRAGGRLYRGRVYHAPYKLQQASVSSPRESLIESAGISHGEEAPHALYSRQVEVDIFGLELVSHRNS